MALFNFLKKKKTVSFEKENIEKQKVTVDRSHIEEAVLQALNDELFDSEAKMEDRLENLMLDSLDFLDIFGFLELDFGIDIPEEEFIEFVTVQDIVDYVEAKTQES